MEACYEKTGSLDAKAQKYWKALRTRAGVDDDYAKTIAATDLSKENDLAVYSGSKMVDVTLYNIRRERRCEFIGEGMRWDDLKRWRSWDQLLTKPYIIVSTSGMPLIKITRTLRTMVPLMQTFRPKATANTYAHFAEPQSIMNCMTV